MVMLVLNGSGRLKVSIDDEQEGSENEVASATREHEGFVLEVEVVPRGYSAYSNWNELE